MFPHRRFYKTTFVSLWIVSLLVNWPLLSSMIFNIEANIKRSVMTTVSLHLLSCTLILLATPKRSEFPWYSREQFWAYTFFLICFFLPLFGHAIILTLFLFYRQPDINDMVKKSLQDEDIIKPQLANDEKFDFVRHSADLKKKIDEGVNLLPLSDIMAGQDVELKRGAVEKIIQFGTREAIDTLLTYRKDPSPDVRFFVTSAITRYKKVLDEDLEATKLEMKKNTTKISIRILLAKLYIKYVESKLLDDISCNNYLLEAKLNLIFATNAEQNNKQSCDMLLDVHERLNEWVAAHELLKHMREKNLITQASFLQHSARINFETHNYPLLSQNLKELMVISTDLEKNWLATANWWGLSS